MSKFLLLTEDDANGNRSIVNVDSIARIHNDHGKPRVELINSRAFHVKESFEELKNLLEVNQ